MDKIIKNIIKFYRNFDISPFEGGNLSKLLIYLIWGINAGIFLGEDFINDHFVITCGSSFSVSLNPDCTILKKVVSETEFNESIELVNSNGFTVISSYEGELELYDIVLNIASRGPPSSCNCSFLQSSSSV